MVAPGRVFTRRRGVHTPVAKPRCQTGSFPGRKVGVDRGAFGPFHLLRASASPREPIITALPAGKDQAND